MDSSYTAIKESLFNHCSLFYSSSCYLDVETDDYVQSFELGVWLLRSCDATEIHMSL